MVFCSTYYSLVLLILTVFFVLSTSDFVPNFTTTTNPKRLALKLIHRFSTASPFYSPNNTFTDYLNEYYGHPQSYTRSCLSQRGDNNPPGVFLVNFLIGDPPSPQSAPMDTGSNMLWVKCHTTKGPQLYDPGKSSTCEAIPCFSSKCNKTTLEYFCDPSDRCMYMKYYAEASYSYGALAFEKLTFSTVDDGVASINHVIFGCSLRQRRLKGTLPWQDSGVFGLGPMYPSVLDNLKQTGFQQFSYCIGSVDDTYYAFNQLILGEGADLIGDKTPLHNLGHHYHVSVVGISEGTKMLDLNPKVLTYREGESSSGVIVDSGTMNIILVPTAYTVLRREVESLLDPLLPKEEKQTKLGPVLCYKGSISEDLKDFPVIIFHFEGGAQLSMDPRSFFYPGTVFTFCMGVYLTSDTFGGSLIGVRAQQFHNVGFDLQGQTLSLQRIDCQLLAED